MKTNTFLLVPISIFLLIILFGCKKDSLIPSGSSGNNTGNNPPAAKPLLVTITPPSHELSLPTNTLNTEAKVLHSVDGSPVIIPAVEWRKISGPAAYSINPTNNLSTTIGNLSGGTYVFECKVTNQAGNSNSATTVISVVSSANTVQRVTLPNQRWTPGPMEARIRINLGPYLATGAVKEVYLKTSCAANPFRIYSFFSAPHNASYTYWIEYFNNSLWLIIMEYNYNGPEYCNLPVDSPDVDIYIQ